MLSEFMSEVVVTRLCGNSAVTEHIVGVTATSINCVVFANGVFSHSHESLAAIRVENSALSNVDIALHFHCISS
jgi:hypothetical protein